MQVRDSFHMDRDPVGSGFPECFQVPVRLLDHQMNVQGEGRDPMNRLDHGRSDGQIGNEVAVHHIQVNKARPGILHAPDLLSQAREVRREHGGSQQGPSSFGSSTHHPRPPH